MIIFNFSFYNVRRRRGPNTTQHTVHTQAHNTTACRGGGAAAAGRGGSLPAVRSASAQTEVTLRHATTGHRGAVGRGQYNAHPGGHFLHIMVISEALELRFCLLKILFPSISIVYINTEKTYLIVVIVIFLEIKQLK